VVPAVYSSHKRHLCLHDVTCLLVTSLCRQSVVPAIWLLELNEMERRIRDHILRRNKTLASSDSVSSIVVVVIVVVDVIVDPLVVVVTRH